MTDPVDSTLSSRLADIRDRLDHPPGVVLGVLRLPILDGITDELEAQFASVPENQRSVLDRDVLTEIERMVDLLAGPSLGAAPEAQGRRIRLVEVLRQADRGRLPPRAFDHGD